jgi:DNA-directed RNA polymerase II subunit RPB2
MNPKDISWKTIDRLFGHNENFVVKHHLDSYNEFFSTGIKEIFKDRNPLRIFKDLDKKTKLYKYECDIYLGGVNADKIYYGKPIIYDDDREHYMYPNEARLRNMTYGFTIHYDIVMKVRILIDNQDGSEDKSKFTLHEEIINFEKVYLGKFPIMLQSNMCLLQGINREARLNMGECRNDNGGYFIIDGNEKVIVSQEGRGDNLLYVLKDVNDIYSFAAEIKSVSEDAAKPKRTLSVRVVKESPSQSNNHIVVNIPQVRKPVPLFIVFRALGVISDKEIIQTCLLDMDKHENIIDLFIPSIHDAGNIFTQQAAISFISSLTKGKTNYHTLQILMNYFLPHVGELNFKTKALFLGYIVKRLLGVYTGQEKPTDRDSYEFKRISVSGKLIHDLFGEYYKLQLDNIYLKIDFEYLYEKNKLLYKNTDFSKLFLNNKEKFFNERIVEVGFRKAFKGNWGATAHTKRPGVCQELNRLSFWGFLCHLRKTNLYIGSDGAKVIAPRLLSCTQYGLLCPLHSPDGGNIGLHKHLSTSTIITKGCSGRPYIKYLRKLNVKLLEECSLTYMKHTTKVFINGSWIGCTSDPIKITNIIKCHRRNGMINIYTSVAFNIKMNEISICTDAGRPMRPLFYLMNGEISFERENVLAAYENDSITWKNITTGFNNQSKDALLDECIINITEKTVESLIKNSSVVDYLDTPETNTILLAHSEDKREDYIKKKVTHCEIHPSLILGLMANQIIYPENNPYPRDAFSCGQSKQAVSLYNSNYQSRFDKTSFVLNYGQIPLTKSRYLKYATNEEHTYGENAIVAVMCYSGFNVEDAVIINEASLKRGLFRTTYYNTYQAFEETEKMGSITVEKKFMNVIDNNVVGLKAGYEYNQLDKHSGIIKENTIVTEKSVIIGMGINSISEVDTYIDDSVYAKKGQVGVVDKSFMTEGEEGKRIAKVRIRGERIPQIGDKFCSRAGQKGTVGIVMRECDMPCTADGIRPDIIVNPHAMPSRMTIGHLVETLTSKTACLYGGFGDCTAFTNKGPKTKQYGEMLTKQGYHSSGNQILYNGMTGEQLETEIYFGPTYYLRLKHMPKDKINYRARGPRTALTRQTVQGRANNGGLRIGEMDRDCLIAHGMSGFVQESMMVRGDQFYMAICNKTGCVAVYNETNNIFLSPMADGPVRFVGNLVDDLNIINVSKYGRDFSIIAVPYAFKLLMQELQTMNIKMRLITEDNVERLMSLTKGDDIEKLSGNKFVNVEQIQNEVNKILSKDNKLYPDANAELTPTPEYDWFDDAQEKVNKVIDGTSVNIPDLDEEEYEPVSPTYGPSDGDNSPDQLDINLSNEDTTEETGFRNFDTVKNTKKLTMVKQKTPEQMEQIAEYGEEGSYGHEYNNEDNEELTDDVVNYERGGLGNADEAKEEEADKIIKTVSSINDQKTEGLELLLPEENKEEETTETTKTKDTKKIKKIE